MWKEGAVTYRTHDSCLPVELYDDIYVSYISRKTLRSDLVPTREGGGGTIRRPVLIGMAGKGGAVHTRSSPTGPAEHDEGGSLSEESNVSVMSS